MSDVIVHDPRTFALNRLVTPGTSLMGIGIAGAMFSGVMFPFSVLVLGASTLGPWADSSAVTNDSIVSFAVWSAWYGMSFLGSVLAIIGGWNMRTGRRYGLALLGAVAATLPVSSPCCCFVGMPFGIWALITLLDPNIKVGFR